MSIMEVIYDHLHENAFVDTAEKFSTDWCWRSKSWFAVQKNKNGDLSVSVAINCLNTVKMKIALAQLRKKKFGSIAESDIRVLGQIKSLLEDHLLEQHRIAAVADAELPNGKML